MKGIDVSPYVSAAQAAVAHLRDAIVSNWPGIAAGGTLVAVGARWGKAALRAFGHGYERFELVQQRDDARADLALSEHERMRMRNMIADLRSDVDAAEAHSAAARERLRELEDMLETRSANEWQLYQDREHAMNWGRTVADRLSVLGETPPIEPPLLGIPVAEPDEIVKQRFAREREALAERFQMTAHRAVESSKLHPPEEHR